MSLLLLFLSLISAAAAGILYLFLKYPNRAVGTDPRPDLPSYQETPIIGIIPRALRFGDKGLEAGYTVFRELGIPSTRTVPFIRFVDVTKPEFLEHVQKTNFGNYVKGSLFRKFLGDFLGHGIFGVDGENWFVQRKLTSHIFNVKSFKGIISNCISDEVQTLVSIIKDEARQGKRTDLSKIFYRFTWDAFGKMAFSHNFHTLTSDSPDVLKLSQAFEFVNSHIDVRFNLPWALYLEPFSATGRKYRESLRLLDDFAYSIIDNRMTIFKAGEKSENGKDLLELFMGATTEDGAPLDRKFLRDMFLNLFLAGRDTTAQALQWCFFYLCNVPDLVPHLREEIESVLGRDGEVDYDNYNRLVRVQAVLYETLRLHPSVPVNVRICLADDQIPNGPLLKKGEVIRWSDWQMARDPSVWGEDCCEFKPWSRWIEKNKNGEEELKRYSPWKFHAFNAGPRLCLGQTLATYEAVAVIVALIQNFDFAFEEGWWEALEKSEGTEGNPLPSTPMYLGSTTLPMKHPLEVKFREIGMVY